MHYYNDNDRRAAAWLRELIAAGELPAGEVDERSILDVKPDDLRGFDQCHFFAGIGGWPLALRWAGLETRSGTRTDRRGSGWTCCRAWRRWLVPLRPPAMPGREGAAR